MNRLASKVVSKARKAIEDSNLLKLLQSEINYELSSNPFQGEQSGSLGDFTVDWDEPKSKDVVLRRKSESGVEVAVSALLGEEISRQETKFPRDVLMKVCVKKPGLCSFLQFDCGVFENGIGKSDFLIREAFYLQSPSHLGSSVYKSPAFSTLDPELQDALKRYLIARGIEKSLTNFLLCHLHKKEQDQYVNWLHKVKTFVEGKTTHED
ncbi:hypothetical protein ACFE04_029492 [Oxalis oulophora]